MVYVSVFLLQCLAMLCESFQKVLEWPPKAIKSIQMLNDDLSCLL